MIGRIAQSLSLRARLTLWYCLVLLVVSVIAGAIVVWQQGRIGLRRVDRELDALSATLENVLRDELNETADSRDAALEAERTLAAPDHAIVILDAGGGVLAQSRRDVHLTLAPSVPATPAAWTAITERGAWRVHLRAVSPKQGTFSLAVAAPLDDVLRERREAQEALWVGVPIVLLLAAGGGLWLATIGLRPISAMARRAETLAPAGMEDLGESDRRDELGQLARAFNGLVARLRQTLQAQRQFMADASHELRTPLSILQTTADVTLARDGRGESDYRDALETVGAEARRLGRLVDDMLVLARADAGGYPLRREHLYLNELVHDCGKTMEVIASERHVTLRASGERDVPFFGDGTLLRRMLLNLLQNAVVHTREGGVVAVELVPNGQQTMIRVRDEGSGIADTDRARIFDRFVQLDAARHGAGAGLGLPIARWIADIHGGSLELEDSSSAGSTFRVVLPTSPSSRRACGPGPCWAPVRWWPAARRAASRTRDGRARRSRSPCGAR
jgi:heavy metal sensor kinase